MIEKLEKDHSLLVLLKKDSSSTVQQQRVFRFIEDFDLLFDISLEGSMEIIRTKK